MKSKKSKLMETWRVREIPNHRDLVDLINCRFSNSSAGSNRYVIKFFHEQDGPLALQVQFSKALKIHEVTAGPALTDEDVDSIKADIDKHLLGQPEFEVRRAHLFSNAPVNGAFSCIQNGFQILPVPPQAPRPGFIYAPNPFILEYEVQKFDVALLNHGSFKANAVLLFLIRMLRVVLLMDITEIRHHHYWVLQGDCNQGLWSEMLQEGYTYHPANHATVFTDVSQWDQLAQIPEAQYYRGNWGGTDDSHHIVLPDTVAACFEAYRHLSAEERSRFDNALFWFSQACESRSRSSSFVALVQAIEALMGRSSGPRCQECGQEKEQLKRKFVAFVESLGADDPNEKKDREKLYDARSSLAHGGVLAHDLQGFSTSLHPSWLIEFDDGHYAWQVTRMVLLRWLRKGNIIATPGERQAYDYFTASASVQAP